MVSIPKTISFLGNFDAKGPNSAYYVILPSSKGLRWLIPTRPDIITSALALYQPSLSRAKLLKTIMILLGRIGLARLLIRGRVSFNRNDAEVQKIFGRDDLQYAFFMGTEGCHRKVTVQVMAESGTILGYIKVSDTASIDKLLDNEAQILEDLSRLEIGDVLFPKVLYKGKVKGINILAFDTLKSTKSTFSNRLSDKHIAFLSGLLLKTVTPQKFSESPFVHGLAERANTLGGKTARKWNKLYLRALDTIDNEIGDKEVPFGLCHRDFTPWNTFFHEGRLYVFDWEYAKGDYPPLFDIFHFIVQEGMLVRKLKPESLVKKISDNRRLIEVYCDRIGIKQNVIKPLLLCYLLDISLFYIDREESEIEGTIRRTVETWGHMIDLIMLGSKQ